MIGLGLIFAILVTFAWINQPSEAELKTLQQQKDSIALVMLTQDSVVRAQAIVKAKSDSTSGLDTAAIKQSYGSFGSSKS